MKELWKMKRMLMLTVMMMCMQRTVTKKSVVKVLQMMTSQMGDIWWGSLDQILKRTERQAFQMDLIGPHRLWKTFYYAQSSGAHITNKRWKQEENLGFICRELKINLKLGAGSRILMVLAKCRPKRCLQEHLDFLYGLFWCPHYYSNSGGEVISNDRFSWTHFKTLLQMSVVCKTKTCQTEITAVNP